MKRRNRVTKSFCLDRDIVETIKLKAIEENENDSRALDLIVREWADRVEIEPLKSPQISSNLSDFSKTARDISFYAKYLAKQANVIKHLVETELSPLKEQANKERSEE